MKKMGPMGRMGLMAACLLLGACATNPPVKAWTSGQRNACLPEAAAMAQGLEGAGIRAKVLAITTLDWRHAVAVYLYPAGDNRLWVWDANWKSLRVRAYWDDAPGIARVWTRMINAKATVSVAEFL